jgi:acetyl-CoA carboxylase biotin carboxylase subunit
MKNISRVLIANRGEIAVRIIRACKSLGLETVAAVSEADRESLPARMADRAVCVGPPRALDSYLNINLLVTAALGTHSDALHPGYGFLAEQPELAEVCGKNNIRFIGPSPKNIREMGNKLWARRIAKGSGVSTIPGSEKVRNVQEATRVGEELGFPVILKAAAGGGGRGMKIAHHPDDLGATFDTLSAEVQSAFGDGTLYLEKYIPNARHVEVQILGDHYGNIIHLGERDCSLQRRHQKILEEAPATVLSPPLREKICQAAVAIAKSIEYQSAGTVEFVFDQDRREFYFLEMNTRIQVEHPVTEQITGVDLVQEQIHIADQEPLRYAQKDIHPQGHAIECRINAESPHNGFFPAPGRIEQWTFLENADVRMDTHCFPGYTIPPYYDSLIAKVIARGQDRSQAIERMQYFLENFIVAGVETTIPFHRGLLRHPDFLRGRVSTRWLEEVVLPSLRSDHEGN